MEAEPLKLFEVHASLKGYSTAFIDHDAYLYDIVNPGNNFQIRKSGDYYTVHTIKISKSDLEYTAKCMVYLLLAEYNKENSATVHNHINFRVDL